MDDSGRGREPVPTYGTDASMNVLRDKTKFDQLLATYYQAKSCKRSYNTMLGLRKVAISSLQL
jgi:hypothetical protein